VTDIRAQGKGFAIKYDSSGKRHEESFEKMILAAGGKAYPALGSQGELFPLLEQLGHTMLPKRQALAPVMATLGELQALQGVRLDTGASLWEGSNCLAHTTGNLIVTSWGINGPAVMDLTRLISARPHGHLTLSLKLLEFCQGEFDELLHLKRDSTLPVRVFLGAFLLPKAAVLYLRMARLPENTTLGQVTEDELKKLVRLLQDTRLPVKGVRGFEFCQVSAGGVPVGEVQPTTLESRVTPGLYLVGETLDVVGPCGGFNLHYAFGSGALAGRASAEIC
jgi:predicted Rossmann fold flavoprotein